MNPKVSILSDLFEHFRLKGNAQSLSPFGSGHIHDTFRLVQLDEDAPDYLVQRINHDIFQRVPEMMENIKRVCRHLNQKYENGNRNEFRALQLIETNHGDSYWQDASGHYWRVFKFEADLHSLDVAEKPEQIFQCAKGFGAFLKDLGDLSASLLQESIPDFHHLPKRLQQLEKACKANPQNRKIEVVEELNFIDGVAQQMCSIHHAGQRKEIPLRVTHNDTKINNVLLDEQGHARCVIDLDTVMPGFVHYDVGDGLRTTISSAEEDEADLEKVEIDLMRYQAFMEGYFAGCGDILLPKERELLPLSGAMMAYIMGVRMLTDYLLGDVYYKIAFPKHNLQRARAQLMLARRILERLEELKKI